MTNKELLQAINLIQAYLQDEIETTENKKQLKKYENLYNDLEILFDELDID